MPHDHAHDDLGARRPNAPADHLHSHVAEAEQADALRALAAQFVDGFRAAADKAAYLTLAGVPREIPDEAGGAPLKLVDLRMTTEWQVGAASPAFGARELSYLPFPGSMIEARETMAFVYVSLTARREVDLVRFLADRGA